MIVTYFIHELRFYWRGVFALGLSISFFMSSLLLLSIGMGTDHALLEVLGSHLIWVIFFLASLLSLECTIQPDYEDGTLEILWTSPLSFENIVFIKAISHWLCTQFPLIFLTIPACFLLNLSPLEGIFLASSLLLGTWTFSFWGLLCACLTLYLRRSSMLSSLLLLPLTLPSILLGSAFCEEKSLSLGLLLLSLSFFSALVSCVSGAFILHLHMVKPHLNKKDRMINENMVLNNNTLTRL